MDDLDEQVKQVMKKAARTRYEFVLVELRTCFTCLDMGKYQFSVGDDEAGRKEIDLAERGLHEAERFSAGFAPEEMAGIAETLTRLKRDLEDLKRERNSQAG